MNPLLFQKFVEAISGRSKVYIAAGLAAAAAVQSTLFANSWRELSQHSRYYIVGMEAIQNVVVGVVPYTVTQLTVIFEIVQPEINVPSSKQFASSLEMSGIFQDCQEQMFTWIDLNRWNNKFSKSCLIQQDPRISNP